MNLEVSEKTIWVPTGTSCNEIHQQLQSNAILSHLHDVSLGQEYTKDLKNRSIEQIMARQSHIKYSLDFLDK